MKIKYLLIAGLVVLSGCGQSAESTSADNGLLEVESTPRLLTAADVNVKGAYEFAYSDQVVSDYDTFKQGQRITITAEENPTLAVYGSDTPISDYQQLEPLIEHSFTSNEDEIVIEDQFTYYTIVANEDSDIVIAVN